MRAMRRRQQQQQLLPGIGRWHKGDNTISINWRRLWRKVSANRINLIMLLIIIALAPPFFFHFRLRRFSQMQLKNCGWVANPPLVCAHGGDSTNSFPNTMAAYHSALRGRADCIEIDVSRSSDGTLFALHDRDLQRISGNDSSRVGLWNNLEISELDAASHFPGISDDQKVPTVEDALMLMSNSVRRVILDVKVGPPFYERGLAEDILTVVKRASCWNCVIWAKSDSLVREIIYLSPNTTVGYIIMKDPSTGSRSNLLRMKKAGVVGVYHQLIDENLVQILHGRNKKIYAWTVDDLGSMRDMLSSKVDAVVTSNPGLLQQLMEDTRFQCREDGFSSA